MRFGQKVPRQIGKIGRKIVFIFKKLKMESALI